MSKHRLREGLGKIHGPAREYAKSPNPTPSSSEENTPVNTPTLPLRQVEQPQAAILANLSIVTTRKTTGGRSYADVAKQRVPNNTLDIKSLDQFPRLGSC